MVANIASTGPMFLLGVTDPRGWPASSWLSDLVPHLAYGLATAAVYERMQPADRWTRASVGVRATRSRVRGGCRRRT